MSKNELKIGDWVVCLKEPYKGASGVIDHFYTGCTGAKCVEVIFPEIVRVTNEHIKSKTISFTISEVEKIMSYENGSVKFYPIEEDQDKELESYPILKYPILKYPEKNEETDLSKEAKFDSSKLKISLVPRKIIWDIAKVRMYGTKKYKDPDNWKKVEASRYRDALMRHILKYLDNPHGVDEESGLKHLWHAACNIAFLCELEDAEEERFV